MRILVSLWIVFLTLTCFGDERIPKQHISTANADNLAVAINPSQTHALIVGKRLISPSAPQNFTVGTIELIKLSNGLSDPSFHEALDPAGNIIRDGDAVPSDAGVIYVNPLKVSSNADCSSVAWVSDNEAWAVCKQNSLSGTTTVNIPLFLVRIRPNEAEKVKVFGTNIGVGPDLANKNYYSLASNSLLVDGNYLVVGGGVGSSSLDTKSFLAKFSIASEPPTTAWAPETMMKYGPVNNALSGLAKMTSGSSSYYVTLNRGGGRYFLGKHNSSDLTDVSSSSGVIPGFFSSVQLPSFDVTKMKLNAIMANGSNVYLAGSYDDNAVIVAVKDDGSLNTDFNARSSTDSAGVLRLKPANQVFQIKGADENIVFGKAELNAIRVTSTGGLIGIGFVSYAPPASVKFSDQIPYYGGLVVELDSTASSAPVINAHVGAPYDWNSTYYRHGEMVGSRLVVAGYKQFFVSAATTGGFYQSFTKGASGYLPAGGVDSCVVVLPKKKFKPSEMRKDIKLFINGSEVTEPAAGALGYLDSNFSERIGRRSFGRNSDRGVTTLNPAQLPADSCTTDRCSYSEPAIRFILGGKSAYKVSCSIRYKNEQNAEVESGQEIDLGVEVSLPIVTGQVTSAPSDKAQNPVVKVNSTESGSLNFFSDSACMTPFASPGSSAINAGQDLSIAVGSIQDNVDTQIYAQATSSAGTLKSACVLVGSYRRDLIAPAFASANLLTESPNKTLRPSIGITGYTESSDVTVGVFSDANCLTSIDVERTVSASALNSFRIENGINANSSNTLYVRLGDLAGNKSDCKPAGVFVNDTIAPVIGRFRINNGASSTTSRIVDLILNGSSDAVAYCLANADAGACSSDQSFTLLTSSNLNYLLSDGFGNKTLVAKLRDQAGNVSEVGTAQISYVDNSTTTTTTVTSSSSTTTTVTSSSSTTTTVTTTTLPDTTPRIVANNGEQYTNQPTIPIKVSAYGALKARIYRYNCYGSYNEVNLTNGQTSETTWRVYSPGSVNIVYGQFYYPNGRVSACLGSNPFTQDSQGPHLHTPQLLGGATQGASNAAEVPATFSYYAHDTNPIVGVRYGSQGCSSDWIALSPSKRVNNQITVAIPRRAVSNTSSFYFQVKDIAGNESSCVSARISYPQISYFLRQNYTSSIINTRLWAYGNRVVSMSVSQSPDCGGTSAVFENFSYYPSYPVPRGMNAAQIRLYARVRDTSGFESLCVPMR